MSTTNGQLLNNAQAGNLRATRGGTCLRSLRLDGSAGLVACPAKAGAVAFALCFS